MPSPIAAFALTAALLLGGCASLSAGGEAPGEREFAQVEPGMTREETTRILGQPFDSMKFPRTRTEAWDYQHTDAWGYMAIFSVIFGVEGTVLSTLAQRINDGGDLGQ